MMCSFCGTEMGAASSCAACRLDADDEDITGASVSTFWTDRPGKRPAAIFSAAAWLELRVRSVFAANPRGFSETFKRGSDTKPK
jgi:hypothetical protein